jgi:hypothetical protein
MGVQRHRGLGLRRPDLLCRWTPELQLASQLYRLIAFFSVAHNNVYVLKFLSMILPLSCVISKLPASISLLLECDIVTFVFHICCNGT